ncbi:MAG: pyruvate kinase [Candidatus Dojkabacteria bacterium]
MDYNKKTKIVVTIGPSTWDPTVMKNMIESGMNVARVNGAFADREELEKVSKLVRDVSDRVSLMIDVKGPQIRLNKFAEEKHLNIGDPVIIGSSDKDEIYPLSYPDLYKYLKAGQRIIVGDGDTELIIKEIKDGQMHCEVTYGNVLKPAKGITIPNAEYGATTLTEKDKENIKHCIDLNWDFVSASFIRSAAAAKEVRAVMGDKMKLIAKIENQQGVDNIDEILPEVDGIMIGRGDLGLQLGLEKVPMVQRMLIRKCNEAGKPVITATQMFESMISNPRPTRGEVNDVATAILLRTDAIMLSAETTTGEYPVEAVKYMTKIATEIEPQIEPQIVKYKAHSTNSTDALTKAAAELCINSEDEISKVIVVSKSGTTARLLGRHSIKQPIYAFVSSDFYMRTLMLSKGIFNAFVQEETHTDRDAAIKSIVEKSLKEGFVNKGEKVLLICKTPFGGGEYFPNIFEVINI